MEGIIRKALLSLCPDMKQESCEDIPIESYYDEIGAIVENNADEILKLCCHEIIKKFHKNRNYKNFFWRD